MPSSASMVRAADGSMHVEQERAARVEHPAEGAAEAASARRRAGGAYCAIERKPPPFSIHQM